MNRFAAVICAGALASLASIVVVGCQKGDAADAAGSGTRIGVVDLDKVATDLGWMKDMQGNLDSLKKQLSTELDHAKEQYTAQIQSKKLEFAPGANDKLTSEQQQIIQGMAQVAQNLLVQLQQSANAQFSSYQQQSVMQYRDAIRPIVQQVAEDKRLWFVSEHNGGVLYYDPNSDITDSVIDAARAHPPLLATVPLPQLPNPGTITVNLTTQPTTKPSTMAPSTPQ